MIPESGPLVNVAGWLLAIGSFGIPLLCRELRNDGRATGVLWLSLLLHHAVGIRNAYLGGLASDALQFHLLALQRIGSAWTLGVGEHFYSPLLAFFYWSLGTSKFLGVELSILAFALSCIVFVKLIYLLGLEKYVVPLLALYALPPAVLRYTSTTLREAYQLLFFSTAVYAGLRFRLHGRSAALPLCVGSALLMGFQHNGLIAFAVVLLALLALFRLRPRAPIGYVSRAGAIVAGSMLLAFAVTARAVWNLAEEGLAGSSALKVLVSRTALEAARQYREGGMAVEARTTYGIRLDISSPARFVGSSALIALHYMFAPFPWQIRTAEDVYGFAESLLRFLLLLHAFRLWRRLRGPPRRVVALLLLAYMGLSAMWAIGTVNYGTALRHHVTTTWLLLLVGGPSLLDSLRGWWSSFTGRSPRRVAAGFVLTANP